MGCTHPLTLHHSLNQSMHLLFFTTTHLLARSSPTQAILSVATQRTRQVCRLQAMTSSTPTKRTPRHSTVHNPTFVFPDFPNENEPNRPANQANLSRNCYISVKIRFSALSCAGRKQNKSCYYLSRCANCNILLSRT